MVRRAIRSFESQTYESKRLLILDSGSSPALPHVCNISPDYVWFDSPPESRRLSIGMLRNIAIECPRYPFDLVAHFDSDDWSAPGRLADQVTEITRDYDVAGYHSATFWKEPTAEAQGEAWAFSSDDAKYCLGTSLMYWRDTWKGRHFPDTPIKGEPRVMGADELAWQTPLRRWSNSGAAHLIASVHDDNTLTKISPGLREWRRAPERDCWCKTVMELEK